MNYCSISHRIPPNWIYLHEFQFCYSIARQNRKVQAKKLRVQVHRSINCNQYLIAIFHGLAFILLIVIFVLVIFTCRKFEVQHELTCRTENEEISSISRRVGVDSKPVDVVDSPTDTLPPKEGKCLHNHYSKPC